MVCEGFPPFKSRELGQQRVNCGEWHPSLSASSGYESWQQQYFNELAGVVAYFREWKIAAKSIEELLFWVGFGLASLVSKAS